MDTTELTPKQQSSEAIRQSETILILTGQHPSVDQVAATIGLAMILRKFGKRVTAIISDNLPQQVNFLPTDELDRSLVGLRDFILRVDQKKTQAEQLRYAREDDKLNIYITPVKGGFAPSDVTFGYGDYHYDLAIVLGVPTRARLDKVFAENASMFERLPIVNIDYHRSNEQYGAVNLIEPTAASLCEMLVALAESLQSGMIDETLATCLLTGIMASTDRFTAAHTTSKSLTVAAQMMAAGARQGTIVRSLFRGRDDGRNRSRDQESSGRPATPTQGQSRPQPRPDQPVRTPSEPVAEVAQSDPKPVEPQAPASDADDLPPVELLEEPAIEGETEIEPVIIADEAPILEPDHIEFQPEPAIIADPDDPSDDADQPTTSQAVQD